MTIRASIEEKKKKGTIRKDRIATLLSYDPLVKIPKPAFTLNKDGRKYFNRFCQILLSNKTLTIADVPIITRAARYFEIFSEANENVLEKGAVQKTKTGYTAKNGYFVTMTDAEKRVTDIEALYGMNLSARMKINIPKPEKENPFKNV
jgi:P27 family predicted phage terminase small subunit